MNIKFIPEQSAAELMGYGKCPRTLRLKVTATGRYKGKERLPIAFTTGGKGYRYSEPDIMKHLAKTSSK